jgi:CDP-diacylglycerol--serine O-phosphatidyltransferase
LADIVSFGVAPALDGLHRPAGISARVLDYRVHLPRVRRAASGAHRVCQPWKGRHLQTEFHRLPIPAAAGLIASITLFLLWLAEGEHHLGNWKFVLPPLMLFLSFMMFSRFQYPSFKALNWKTKKSIPRFLIISLIFILTVMNYEWMPAVLFLAYLLYGFLRPWLSREWQREIEEEIGEEPVETTE